jgi:hypothetical protein
VGVRWLRAQLAHKIRILPLRGFRPWMRRNAQCRDRASPAPRAALGRLDGGAQVPLPRPGAARGHRRLGRAPARVPMAAGSSPA